jgi:hypothetical protein
MAKMKDILERLNTDLFSDNTENEFEQLCRKREITIKKNIQRSFDFIDIHIKQPGFEGTLNHWQENKVERNIQNYIDYMELLFSKSSKEEIEKFCKTNNRFLPLSFDRNELIYLNNSFFGSVITDFLWSSDITVADNIKISHNTNELPRCKQTGYL